MFRKSLSVLSISSILLVSCGIVFSQSKSDWSAVKNLVNQEVAIKTSGGKMDYGIIKSVDSNSLVLQIVGSKNLTQDEKIISQNSIEKIWRALLFVNNRSTGKGVLLGAGFGLGAGLIAFSAAEKGPQSGVAVPLFTVVGAGIGGVAGFFTKKKHKKRDLIYKK